MSARSIMPGYGGAYTSEAFDATSTTGADTIDCSCADELMVQVSSTGSPGGDIQLEHTANLSDWAPIGSAISVVDGTISLFSREDGPFGLVRINPAGITAGTAETVIVTIVGRFWNR